MDKAQKQPAGSSELGQRATEMRRQLLVMYELNPYLYEHAKPAADIIDELMRHLGECTGALETMGHPIEWPGEHDNT